NQERRRKRAEQHSSSVPPSGGHLGRPCCLSALEPALMACPSDWAFLSSDVFAGMKIDPKTLVKKLDLDSRSVVSAQTGVEEKTLLSKREKMKLRKDRWLQKIEGVKLARQKQKAEAKRKATPVVGDMQPLMEALPELSELTTTSKFICVCCLFPSRVRRPVCGTWRMTVALPHNLAGGSEQQAGGQLSPPQEPCCVDSPHSSFKRS
uniref:SLX9 ribosome biosis factor n=1 Tax=Chrysemys picta bellii TaxID=8478 RepID=A0A8C3F910_CHRPI